MIRYASSNFSSRPSANSAISACLLNWSPSRGRCGAFAATPAVVPILTLSSKNPFHSILFPGHSVLPDTCRAYYLECAVPGHRQFVEPSRVHADLIVRGDAPAERLLGLLVTLLPSKTHSPIAFSCLQLSLSIEDTYTTHPVALGTLSTSVGLCSLKTG
jgi:hypothetical protein